MSELLFVHCKFGQTDKMNASKALNAFISLTYDLQKSRPKTLISFNGNLNESFSLFFISTCKSAEAICGCTYSCTCSIKGTVIIMLCILDVVMSK